MSQQALAMTTFSDRYAIAANFLYLFYCSIVVQEYANEFYQKFAVPLLFICLRFSSSLAVMSSMFCWC